MVTLSFIEVGIHSVSWDLTSDTNNSIRMLKVMFTDSLDLITSIAQEAQKHMTGS